MTTLSVCRSLDFKGFGVGDLGSRVCLREVWSMSSGACSMEIARSLCEYPFF